MSSFSFSSCKRQAHKPESGRKRAELVSGGVQRTKRASGAGVWPGGEAARVRLVLTAGMQNVAVWTLGLYSQQQWEEGDGSTERGDGRRR